MLSRLIWAHVSKKRWTLHRSQSVRRTNQRGCNFGHYVAGGRRPERGATNTKAGCRSLSFGKLSGGVWARRNEWPAADPQPPRSRPATAVTLRRWDSYLPLLPLTPRWHTRIGRAVEPGTCAAAFDKRAKFIISARPRFINRTRRAMESATGTLWCC